MAAGNFAGQLRADGTVDVLERIAELATGFGGDGRQAIAHHPFGQFAPVEGDVARFEAKPWPIRQTSVGQDRGQIQAAMLVGGAGQALQQFGTADQILEAAHAQAGHQLRTSRAMNLK